jgi:hypothetical protein
VPYPHRVLRSNGWRTSTNGRLPSAQRTPIGARVWKGRCPAIWKNAGTRVFDLSPDRKFYGWPKFF